MLAENNCTDQHVVSNNCLSTSALPNVGPSQVLPFLYLGSQDDALSTQTMKVGDSDVYWRSDFASFHHLDFFLGVRNHPCHQCEYRR